MTRTYGEAARPVQVMNSSIAVDFNGLQVVRATYISQIGQEKIDLAGAAVAATVPEGMQLVRIAAIGGPVHFRIDGTDADADSAAVPQNTAEWLPVQNKSISVYGAVLTDAHLTYFSYEES